MSVYITDFVTNPEIEKKILGDFLTLGPSPGVEVLLVWHQKIDSAYLSQFPNLKAVIRYGVGFENIDLTETKRRNILACNTPDYGVGEVADTALAMILGLSRNIFSYHYTALRRNPNWQSQYLEKIKRTQQTKLGIIGAGRIGSLVALKAKALGFSTAIFDPYQERGLEKVLDAKRYDSLDEILPQSDIISIHTPLTDQTNAMVDGCFLEKMKNGSILINTARGKIIKDLSLIHHAIKAGKLWGAGLDVLPEEPPVSNLNIFEELSNQDSEILGRLIINPHTAFYSQESFIEMRQKAAENALRVIKGLTPFNILKEGLR